MASFRELMRLSARQTGEQKRAVDLILQDREDKAKQQRIQALQKEADEKRQEREALKRHFEQEKQKKMKEERALAAQKAREEELTRREDEQRDALRYGPKRSAKPFTNGAKHGASLFASRDSPRKTRDSDDDNADSGAGGLTREELRERKQQAELRKLYSTKRSTHTVSYSKAGKKLPGGAVDIAASSQTTNNASAKSVKDRITAMPNALVKLNIVKRDTRTIDEILQDRAKLKELKTLDGDEARGFSDWFPSAKREAKKSSPPLPSTTASSASTPATQITKPSSAMPVKKSNGASSAGATPARSHVMKHIQKSATNPGSFHKPATSATKSNLSGEKLSFSKSTIGKIPKTYTSNNDRPHSSKTPHTKKRPRSLSVSETPLPSKRHHRSPALEEDIGSTIWKLFGRDRTAYVAQDVMSDDEDMEVDASFLEREEKISARIAEREEMQALDEERRHEEEKRRRKKEKNRF